MSQTLFLLYRPEPARPMSQAGTGGYGIRPYVFCRGGEGRVFPCCVCRGDHWSPANLPLQRIFRDGFLARQTGRDEQCSPLQAFFGSSAEGSRPLPTEQKEKSASKETCPGEINPAPAHKRQSCNNGKAAGRALGGAQRAPPVCKQTRSCGCLPRKGKHCSLHAHNPAMPGPYATVRF